MRAKAGLLLAPLLLAACASSPALADKAPPVRKTALIPFEPLRNHGVPLVQVRLNDQITGTFLVDTGASECLMTDDMARRLKLKTHPAFIRGFIPASFGNGQNYFAKVKHVQLGPVLLTEVPFVVLKSDASFTFFEQHVDGIIGGPVLSQFAMMVDFPRHVIGLISPGNLSNDEVQKLGLGSAVAVPLKQDHMMVSPLPPYDEDISEYSASIECQNGASKGKDDLYVDTGAPGTSISEDLAERLHMTAEDKQGVSLIFRDLVLGNIGRVPSLRVGSLTLQYPLVAYPGTKDAYFPSLLGEDILAYCTVLFDFPRKMLYLQPVLPPIATEAAADATSSVDLARLRQDAQSFLYAPAALATSTLEDASDTPAQVALLQSHCKGDASDAPLYAQIGDAYHEDGQDGQAQTAYAKAASLRRALLQAKPNDPAAMAHLAEALSSARQDSEAETVARNATAQAGGTARAWIALGRVLHARSLLALTGRNTSPDVSEGYLEYEAQIARLRAAPPSAAQQAQAQALSREARACFDKAIALAPNDRQTYAARADFVEDDGLGISAVLHALRGQNPDLVREPHPTQYFLDVDQVAKLAPADPEIQQTAALNDANAPFLGYGGQFIDGPSSLWKSLSPRTRHSVQEKMDRLDVLAKGTDALPTARALLAQAQLRFGIWGDAPQAETLLRRALVLVPGQPNVCIALTQMLSGQVRYEDAAALLSAQLKQTDTALLHLLLARTLERQGNWTDAETQAQRALTMKPDSFTANIALAMLLLHRTDTSPDALAQAQVCLGKAQAALGTNPSRARASEFSIALSILTDLNGDPAGAKQTILSVLTEDRSNTQARDVLAALFL